MGDLAKVRFQITEANLIGYRAYDYALGSQNPTTGGDNNTDTPVLVYKINSHFDIKREYNPGTGEETNVISENDDGPPLEPAPVHARRLVAKPGRDRRRLDAIRS